MFTFFGGLFTKVCLHFLFTILGNPAHHAHGSKSDMMGSLKNAGSMASSVMAAGIQRVGEKVRALSGSTALTKQDLHAMHSGLNVPTTDDHIVTQNSVRSGSAEKTLGKINL